MLVSEVSDSVSGIKGLVVVGELLVFRLVLPFLTDFLLRETGIIGVFGMPFSDVELLTERVSEHLFRHW